MPTRQKIEKISVVGAGVMGNGLAHVFALNNFAVILLDIKDELLEKRKVYSKSKLQISYNCR